MQPAKFVQPDSCETDKCYYYQLSRNGSEVIYRKVKFLSYCPHPAEVIIHDGKKPRVIHRCFLYEKVSDCRRNA